MRIEMLQTQRGSVDGITVALYLRGSVHELDGIGGERLARIFIDAGMAREVGAPGLQPERQTAAHAAAPENRIDHQSKRGAKRRH